MSRPGPEMTLPRQATRPTPGAAAAALLLALSMAACDAAPGAARTAAEQSLHFDGVDAYVDLGRLDAGHPLLLAARPFTVAAWFTQEEGGDPFSRLIDRSDGQFGRNGWALGVDAADGAVHFYVHDGRRGADFVSSRQAAPPGRRHHVVAVARSGALEIWVDGRRDRGTWYESGAHTLPSATPGPARIGTWCHDTGREWKGWIDDLAVWSNDLQDSAIEDLFAAGGGTDLRRAAGHYRQGDWLIGWWRMGDGDPLTKPPGTAAMARDASRVGTHGALLPAAPFGAPPVFGSTPGR